MNTTLPGSRRLTRRGSALVIVGFGLVALLGACGAEPERPAGASPVSDPDVYVLPPPAAAATATTVSPTRAQFLRLADGTVLPDPAVTPGSIFADVTAEEICPWPYTAGIRQPRFNRKVEAFANYGISISERDVYHVDHLVPLSLGGDNSLENLWPQPYDEVAGADQKNQLERQLRGLVCSGTITLAHAQAAMRTDWTDAYDEYMSLPIDPGSDGPPQPSTTTTVLGQIENGLPCVDEGEIGITNEGVRLICTATRSGALEWQKRY